MRRTGSLSTILAGVLILIAMGLALMIILSIYSLVITLGQSVTTHVQRVGELESVYSGLILSNGQLMSSKGPITIIGEITRNHFTWINITTTSYTPQTSNPTLLLTNVGPILIDPQGGANNDLNYNYVDNYLYHWVNAIVTTSGSPINQGSFSGIVLNSTSNNYFILHIDPNYVVGPLTSGNFYVTKDYGMGPQACIDFYSYNPGNPYVWQGSNCPVPVPGPVTIGWFPLYGRPGLYQGYWPILNVTQVNNTAVEYSIFFNGTFYAPPEYLVINILSLNGNMPQWVNITCGAPTTGSYNTTLFNELGGNLANCQYPLPNQAVSDPYVGIQTVPVVAIVNNVPSGEYYFIIIVKFNVGSGLSTAWFVWLVNGDNAQYPNWLTIQSTPAQYEPAPNG